MNYETVLLVGGPMDGERISVLAGVREIKFSSLPRSAARIENPDPAAPVPVPVESVWYRREPMRSSKGFDGAVYVIDNGVDAIPALIEGYRGSRKSFEAMAELRGYNIEQYEGRYVSKITQELYDFWSRSARNPG